MGSEWRTVRLGNHVESCLGKMLDQNKNRGTLHPYLGNKQVRWGSFDLEDLSEMKFEDHEHERYGLRFGDLVVCEGGEPGRCALWKDEVPNMKIQKALHRIRPKKGLDNTFLHYWFCYAGKFELLEPYFTGTTIKHLTGKAVAELQIPLPPLPEQKAIAHILGSLDDKIELNRRMNATLEGMAQALFKSWFVDFDPVIDNALVAGNPIPDELADRAEVRRQALADGTANRKAAKHFPANFQQTESMGWIPVGWQVLPLDQVADFKNGLALQKFRPKSGEKPLPIVKIAQLQTGYATWDEVASPSISPYCIIDDGDVVFSWSGSLMIDVWCGGKAALNQHLFKVTSDNFPKWFYFKWSDEHLNDFQKIAADKAVTMGHIKRSHLSEALCAVPCKDLEHFK